MLSEFSRRTDDLLEQARRAERGDADPWLGLPEIKRHCGMGRCAVQAAGGRGLEVHGGGDSGRPIRVRRSEIDRWLSTKPYRPQPTKDVSWAEGDDAAGMQDLRRLAGANA